jgi:hypothetical protein
METEMSRGKLLQDLILVDYLVEGSRLGKSHNTTCVHVWQGVSTILA